MAICTPVARGENTSEGTHSPRALGRQKLVAFCAWANTRFAPTARSVTAYAPEWRNEGTPTTVVVEAEATLLRAGADRRWFFQAFCSVGDHKRACSWYRVEMAESGGGCGVQGR